MTDLSQSMVSPKKLGFPTKDRNWVPLIWLPYFIFFLLKPFFEHVTPLWWLFTGLGCIAFLFFFFGMFWSQKWAWYFLAGLVLLGVIFAPINSGASTFFIYAVAFCPFLSRTEKGAIKVMAAILSLVCLEYFVFHLHWSFLMYGGGIAAVIGAGNIVFAARNRANEKLRMAHEEIEHLAKIAERERIARDMHDILGHTLSVIILKSELAGKLIDLDPARAKNEIRDVEQTSRQALSEVRNAIRGYREQTLDTELKQAKATLETAGVEVKSEASDVSLTPAQESVVALVVREAVTNVVRHAQAQHCSLRMIPMNGNCLLEIEDDGRGGVAIEGNGLRGMRERIEALGGTLERENHAGTKLKIQFPLKPPKASVSQ